MSFIKERQRFTDIQMAAKVEVPVIEGAEDSFNPQRKGSIKC